MVAEPPEPPQDDDESSVDELYDRHVEVLQLLQALGRERVTPDGVLGLHRALARLAVADAAVVEALARLDRDGTMPVPEVQAATAESGRAVEDVLATLPRAKSRVVVNAMEEVEISEDEGWEAVDEVLEPDGAGSDEVSPEDECPCGSGETYGECCASEPERTRALRFHDIDSDLTGRMFQFGSDEHEEALNRAIERFERVADPEQGAFLLDAYVTFHANVEGGRLVDAWLEAEGGDLAKDEREWIESNRRAVLSVWEVTGVDEGRSLDLHDLLTDERRTVLDHQASITMRPGSAICARVVDHEGLSLLVGLHLPAIPVAEAKEIAMGLVRCLSAPGAASATCLPRGALEGKGSRRVLEAWCDADAVVRAGAAARALPTIQNTSGDAFEWTTDRYEFDPRRRKEIERAIVGIPDVGPEKAYDTDPAGASAYGKSVAGSVAFGPEGRTSHGRIVVSDGRVVVETNSAQRSDALRAELFEACGDALRPLARQRQGLEDLMRTAAAGVGSPGTNGTGPRGPEVAMSAEMAAALRGLKEKHYARWLDERLPALGGATPRSVAANPRRRAEVEDLVAGIEAIEAKLPAPERFDASWLRRELRLPPARG